MMNDQFKIPPICTQEWMREVAEHSVEEDVYAILVSTRGSGKTIFALKYANWLVQNFPGIRVLVRTKNLKRDEVINTLCHDYSRRDIYASDPVLRFVHRHGSSLISTLDVVCSEDTTVLRGHRYNIMFHDDCVMDDHAYSRICDLKEWWTPEHKTILTSKHILLGEVKDIDPGINSFIDSEIIAFRRNRFYETPDLKDLSLVL